MFFFEIVIFTYVLTHLFPETYETLSKTTENNKHNQSGTKKNKKNKKDLKTINKSFFLERQNVKKKQKL